MPYDKDNAGDVKSMKEKLSKTYSSVSDTAVRQAIAVFNSVMDEHNDEGRAWAGVYSQLNKRGLSKKASSYPRPSDRIVKDVAKDMADLIAEAEIPLEVRQKATHIYDLVNKGHLRQKWVEERLWEGSQDYIYQTEDFEEQGELAGNVEGEVADLLVKQGIIGRRAKMGTLSDEIERVASKHPEHAEALNAIAKESVAIPKDAKALWKLVQSTRKAYYALEAAAKIRLPREYRIIEGELNYSFESLYNTLSQIEDAWDNLSATAKMASGWVPGELREDRLWEPGRIDETPTAHREEGSQVPPARDHDGNQLDDNDVPVDSIPRVATVDDAWDKLAEQVQNRRTDVPRE